MITVKKDAIKIKTPEGMQSAGVLCNVGVVTDNLKYATTLASIFKTAKFPENHVLNVNIPNIGNISGSKSRDISYAFQVTKGVKKIILKCNQSELPISGSYAFSSSVVEEIDFSEFYPVFTSCGMMFSNATNLKTIKGELDFSLLSSLENQFNGASELVDIQVKKESFSGKLVLSYCSKLSDKSIDSLVNGFADMTGQTASVFSVNKSVKARIEANPVWLATLTSKNVTLA